MICLFHTELLGIQLGTFAIDLVDTHWHIGFALVNLRQARIERKESTNGGGELPVKKSN